MTTQLKQLTRTQHESNSTLAHQRVCPLLLPMAFPSQQRRQYLTQRFIGNVGKIIWLGPGFSYSAACLCLECLPSYDDYTPILPSCETTAFVCSKKSSAGGIRKYRFVPWCCFCSCLLRKWNEYPRVDPVTYPEQTVHKLGSVSILPQVPIIAWFLRLTI